MLEDVDEALTQDLELLNYPPKPWVLPEVPERNDTYDVVIVGAGMAGLAVGFALLRLGINNIHIVDSSPQGYEGPWETYARMLTLRSGKSLVGPALDIPQLTFQAWYKAKFGQTAWDQLYKIPNHDWMDYLRWYRQTLKLPVSNEQKLTLIHPGTPYLTLKMSHNDEVYALQTRKLVLATGRDGFGGLFIPSFVKSLPSTHYAHTGQPINFKTLYGKRICIIGVGASAFDAAAAALENGSAHVDMLSRRECIPYINKAASLNYPGFSRGFYQLDDEARWEIFSYLDEVGAPPPFESLDRIRKFSQFKLKTKIDIQHIQLNGQRIEVSTNQGNSFYDFLIFATGFEIDIDKQQELALIKDQILLWQNRPCAKQSLSSLGNFPYLGSHYEFKEKTSGNAPYLRHIYCFNYAASLSHGLLSGDIPDISVGVKRLAEGIAADFFIEQWRDYKEKLQNFDTLEFRPFS